MDGGVTKMAYYARMHGYSIGDAHIRTFFKNMGIMTTHNQVYKQKKHREKNNGTLSATRQGYLATKPSMGNRYYLSHRTNSQFIYVRRYRLV